MGNKQLNRDKGGLIRNIILGKMNININSFSKFGSSSRSTAIWNIFDMITKTIPISRRINKSCLVERSISLRVFPTRGDAGGEFPQLAENLLISSTRKHSPSTPVDTPPPTTSLSPCTKGSFTPPPPPPTPLTRLLPAETLKNLKFDFFCMQKLVKSGEYY